MPRPPVRPDRLESSLDVVPSTGTSTATPCATGACGGANPALTRVGATGWAPRQPPDLGEPATAVTRVRPSMIHSTGPAPPGQEPIPRRIIRSARSIRPPWPRCPGTRPWPAGRRPACWPQDGEREEDQVARVRRHQIPGHATRIRASDTRSVTESKKAPARRRCRRLGDRPVQQSWSPVSTRSTMPGGVARAHANAVAAPRAARCVSMSAVIPNAAACVPPDRTRRPCRAIARRNGSSSRKGHLTLPSASWSSTERPPGRGQPACPERVSDRSGCRASRRAPRPGHGNQHTTSTAAAPTPGCWRPRRPGSVPQPQVGVTRPGHQGGEGHGHAPVHAATLAPRWGQGQPRPVVGPRHRADRTSPGRDHDRLGGPSAPPATV